MQSLLFSYFSQIDIWKNILHSFYGITSQVILENKRILNSISASDPESDILIFKRNGVKCSSTARVIETTKLRFDCGSVQVTVPSAKDLIYPLCSDFCKSSVVLNNGTWINGTVEIKVDPDYVYSDRPAINEMVFDCDANSDVFNSTSTSTMETTMFSSALSTETIMFQNATNTTLIPDQCCRITPEHTNTSIIRDLSCDCPVDRSGSTCSTLKRIDCLVLKTDPDLSCKFGNCPVFQNSDLVNIDFYMQCFNKPNMALVNRTGFNYYTISPNVFTYLFSSVYLQIRISKSS